MLALGLTLPLVAALLAARSYRFAWVGTGDPAGRRRAGHRRLVDRGTLPASPTMIPVFLAPYAVALAIGAACFVAGFAQDVRGRRSAGASSSAWSPSSVRSSGWCPCCRRW